MNNHKELETLIAEGIVVLRNERRMRPQKKDIYYYVQDFQENNMLDYDLLCNVFDMIEEGKIYDKYKDSENKESYYNNTKTINSQDLFTPFSDMNNSCQNQHVTKTHCSQHILMLSSQRKVKSSKTRQRLKRDYLITTKWLSRV